MSCICCDVCKGQEGGRRI